MKEPSPKINTFKDPSEDKIWETLAGIEFATKEENHLAEELNVPIEDFQNETREFIDKRNEEVGISPMENFIRKWEKEHLALKGGDELEQISERVLVKPNSEFIPKMSREFISHILYVARLEMQKDKTFRESHTILGSFRDIYKIEIKHSGGMDKLLFEVYVNVGSFLSRDQRYIPFKMDSSGRIILNVD